MFGYLWQTLGDFKTVTKTVCEGLVFMKIIVSLRPPLYSVGV